MWIKTTVQSRENDGYQEAILERFYHFANTFEVYPFEHLQKRYFDWSLPEEFRIPFESFVEVDVLKRLYHFLKIYGHDPEIFREKFNHYIIDLFELLAKRISDGIPFWKFDSSIWEDGLPIAPEFKSEVTEFLKRYGDSLVAVANFATQPKEIAKSPHMSDVAKRSRIYAGLIEKIQRQVWNPQT